MFSYVSVVKAEESDYILLEKQINSYAKNEVDRQFEYLVDLLWDDLDTGISDKKEKAQLGNPFFYYDAGNKSNQNSDFYYPVMVEEKVVGVIEAILYEGNWTLSITDAKNTFKQLNEIDYTQEKPLFYIIGDDVIMETEESSVVLTTLLESNRKNFLQKRFSSKSYEEKLEEIVKNTKTFSENGQGKRDNQKLLAGGIVVAVVVVIIFMVLVRRRKKGGF